MCQIEELLTNILSVDGFIGLIMEVIQLRELQWMETHEWSYTVLI